MTTRFESGLDGLWSTMHEAGHGHYAHGIAPSARAHAACGRALTRTERVAEPDLGEPRRTQPPVLAPLVRAVARDVSRAARRRDLESFLAAVNRADPGLIRVEADETTYSLHIILRFEIEQQLIEGSLDPADLPDAWNAEWLTCSASRYPTTPTASSRTSTGRRAGSATSRRTRSAMSSRSALGVGARGDPEFDAEMEAGELGHLAAWLRDNLYSLGRKLTPKQDDRATDRNARDRSAAVPRLSPREARLSARRCLTRSGSSTTASRTRSRSRAGRCSSVRCGTASGRPVRTSAATRASAVSAPCPTSTGLGPVKSFARVLVLPEAEVTRSLTDRGGARPASCIPCADGSSRTTNWCGFCTRGSSCGRGPSLARRIAPARSRSACAIAATCAAARGYQGIVESIRAAESAS